MMHLLDNKIEGANEFNALAKLYVINKNNVSIENILYKELIVLLCTLLEVNSEKATSLWFIKNKDLLHIGDLKHRKDFQKKLLNDIIELYSNESKRYDYSLYNRIFDNINVLSKEEKLLNQLNIDFKITLGSNHGINEFIRLLDKIGVRDIFAEIDYHEDNGFTDVKTNSKEIINRLIKVRNEIIHENVIDNSIDKIKFMEKSIYCTNQYFNKLFKEINFI